MKVRRSNEHILCWKEIRFRRDKFCSRCRLRRYQFLDFRLYQQQWEIKRYQRYCSLMTQQLGHLLSTVCKNGPDQTARYCNQLNLKCTFTKSKVMVSLIIKEGKLTKSECWQGEGRKTGKLKKVGHYFLARVPLYFHQINLQKFRGLLSTKSVICFRQRGQTIKLHCLVLLQKRVK